MLKVRSQRFFSNGPNLLGFICAMAGIVAFSSLLFIENEPSIQKTIWFGIGTVLIGGVLMSLSSGKMVDLKNSRFREYFSVLGIYFGKWERLPPIKKVELIQHEYISKNLPNGITPTFHTQNLVFKIALISSDKVELVLEIRQEKEALETMDKINDLIQDSNLRLID